MNSLVVSRFTHEYIFGLPGENGKSTLGLPKGRTVRVLDMEMSLEQINKTRMSKGKQSNDKGVVDL